MSPPDAVAPIGGAAPSPEAERTRLREAAEAFEALLVQQLVHRMREAQLDEGFFGRGAGSSIYEGLFEQHLASRLAEDSPFGIARMLLESWTADATGPRRAEDALRELGDARARMEYENALTAAGSAPVGMPIQESRRSADGMVERGRLLPHRK